MQLLLSYRLILKIRLSMPVTKQLERKPDTALVSCYEKSLNKYSNTIQNKMIHNIIIKQLEMSYISEIWARL